MLGAVEYLVSMEVHSIHITDDSFESIIKNGPRLFVRVSLAALKI